MRQSLLGSKASAVYRPTRLSHRRRRLVPQSTESVQKINIELLTQPNKKMSEAMLKVLFLTPSLAYRLF